MSDTAAGTPGGTPLHVPTNPVRFVTADPDLMDEMMLTVTFQPVPGGTEVTLLFEDLPVGLRPADNDAGARLSLEQLARYIE